jgi:hypothetical protein
VRLCLTSFFIPLPLPKNRFGIEPEPALNLLQPIVPKWLSDAYYIFVEQFDWHTQSDFQSKQHLVQAGDKIWGKIEYVASNNTYTMSCGSYKDGWSVSANRVLDNKKEVWTGILSLLRCMEADLKKDLHRCLLCHRAPTDVLQPISCFREDRLH